MLWLLKQTRNQACNLFGLRSKSVWINVREKCVYDVVYLCVCVFKDVCRALWEARGAFWRMISSGGRAAEQTIAHFNVVPCLP